MKWQARYIDPYSDDEGAIGEIVTWKEAYRDLLNKMNEVKEINAFGSDNEEIDGKEYTTKWFYDGNSIYYYMQKIRECR